jgi:xanthine dehydrogenase accessory factor
MDILSKACRYFEEGKKFALATVVDVEGSAPQVIGAKMIVFCDKTIVGTIGGGQVEHQAICDAQEYIDRQKKGLREYSLNKAAGLLCGGKMSVFFETFKSDRKLVIAGAGHIGRALHELGLILGYKITVIDNRKDFADVKLFPKARVKCGNYAKLLKQEKMDENSYVVIATHGHAHDLEALRVSIARGAKYVGMIGSKYKVREHFAILKKEGVAKKVLETIHAPIGLKLGGNSPQEIALSILAQMQSVEYATNNLQFEKLI